MAKYDWNPWEILGGTEGGLRRDPQGVSCRVDSSAPGGLREPAANVVETREAFVVEIELAGVKREDIELELAGRDLSICGCVRQEKDVDGSVYHVLERSFGSFGRAFRLPPGIDPDGVSAVFENGLLRVVVPKKEGRRTSVPVETND